MKMFLLSRLHTLPLVYIVGHLGGIASKYREVGHAQRINLAPSNGQKNKLKLIHSITVFQLVK